MSDHEKEPGAITSALTGRFVLVVEDNDDARTLLATLLTLHGAQVLTAASVREALETFGRARLDLVLTDINMPQQDGFDLIRMLRGLAPSYGGSVPVIALTGFTTRHDRDRFLAAGFDDLLSKPVDPDHLVETILRVLDARPNEGVSE